MTLRVRVEAEADEHFVPTEFLSVTVVYDQVVTLGPAIATFTAPDVTVSVGDPSEEE